MGYPKTNAKRDIRKSIFIEDRIMSAKITRMNPEALPDAGNAGVSKISIFSRIVGPFIACLTMILRIIIKKKVLG